MKALHLIAVIIIFVSTAFTQQNKDDWPNLNRYQSDNENVKKGKKKSCLLYTSPSPRDS